MRRIFYLLFLLSTNVFSQENLDLSYYFGDELKNFDSKIPKPSSFLLGENEVGSSHVSHDRLIQYMYALANSSPRISIENRGKTYEGRPLILLTISSEENLNKIEEIRKNHLSYLNGDGKEQAYKRPVIIYQGYSIHGNEPSGSNAALLYAYYLAASNNTKLINQLNSSVILLDPSFNPDGLQRFAHWANTNKSLYLNSDSNDREFNENWPKGRTNHYWFDMNRDWLPAQLPESNVRIETFHKWYPNVLTDHHEMGTNSTFFYQPGIPSRVNPLTPKKNQILTAEIGKYHEKQLSEIGSLFYSEEDYDDFYFGKGSTFPDINGSIGILFEQGSSRGHLQESINGEVSFPFTIKNQLVTSFSTLDASIGLKNELLDYQHEFFNNSIKIAKKNKNKYIVVGDKKDKSKLFHFYEILNKHKIEIKKLENTQIVNGVKFEKENSFLIPKNQKNIRLIDAMLENRTKFKDSLFYDVSAWSFLHSFDLEYSDLIVKNETFDLNFIKPKGKIISKSEYAYLFSWDDYYTPRALYKLLQNNLRVKVATNKFKVGNKNFDFGTILIPLKNQTKNVEEINKILNEITRFSGINFLGVNSSKTTGTDLGSNSFKNITIPKIGLIVGDGVTSYDAGEIWHLLDTRYQIPVTKINSNSLSKIDLKKYNTIIFANGMHDYTENTVKKLKTWIEDGGNLIGFRNTIKWLNKNNFISVNLKVNKPEANNINYINKSKFYGAQLTSGAIFNTTLDLSHPINYGFYKNNLSVFRNTNIYIENDSLSFNNPIKYTNSNTLISGYISKENLKSINNARPFANFKVKKGNINIFSDNTNFRGFWYGTNKLMMNAIFFANIM
ncbi:M14 family zinc carboxypeptidase [Flavobacteriaceae bacterium]|nr:M14 family zinc carboxypeptidase [Flavobacteriaceae bacterium]MDB4024314.1 M14 family zinc carboxypeptidase [Flavobacteriaceae bacterium]MDB4131209.1 M14 family zinc carboxypeptidase [Flavobacteriaceae bacterium]